MGQYWIPVNLDKKEYVDPHKLGSGLKLWEQLNNPPGTPAALLILTAAMPEARGGGDLNPHPAIGRWAGDRIAVVGDYAEDSDLPNSPVPAGIIYGLCGNVLAWLNHLLELVAIPDLSAQDKRKYRRLVDQIRKHGSFTDVSDMVCEVIEAECDGEFRDEPYRYFHSKRMDAASK